MDDEACDYDGRSKNKNYSEVNKHFPLYTAQMRLVKTLQASIDLIYRS